MNISVTEDINGQKYVRMSDENKDCSTCIYSDEVNGENCYECVKGMANNYKEHEE